MAMLLVLGVVVALHGVTDVTGADERSELRASSFERNEHLGCDNQAQQLDCDDGLGYRDGKCNECGCCPSCWTCVELHHYECAERNGLTVERHTADLGSIAVGEAVNWAVSNSSSTSTSTSTSGGSTLATAGWLQCAAFPSLPLGLAFSDEGALTGVLQADLERTTDTPVAFFATSTAGWSGGSVQRLEIRFTAQADPVGRGELVASRASGEQARAAAHAHLQAAFAAYQRYYEQHQISHDDCVRQMTSELAGLKAVLDQHPRLADGRFWMWLGGLHMNMHKLLENVLLECELYLGLGLLFPDATVASEARGNLDGCLAKRKLEAAKFTWMRGMERIVDGDWAAAEEMLAAAAGKKEGWGWGVNNGDIWIALGAVQAIRWGEAALPDVMAARPDGLLERAAATLQLAAERRPDHPWTRQNVVAVRELKELVGSPSARDEADEEGTLASKLAWFTAETKRWCGEVLQQVQPKPRPATLPPTPWTDAGGSGRVKPLGAMAMDAEKEL